ncbi:MAG: Spy/CpxP family protein refolding chaperone [Methylocystis sp.]
MNRRLALASAAAALLLPQIPRAAYAAQEDEHGGWKMSEEDRGAFVDARIAALKAGLKLTPAQEKNWPPVEAAVRELAKAKAARKAEWREKYKEQEGRQNLIEGLQHHAKTMEIIGDDLRKLADAAKPLYDSLDDAQKRRLSLLVHHIHGDHLGHWSEHSDGHED